MRKSLAEFDDAFAAQCREVQDHGRMDLLEICCPLDSALAQTVLERGGSAFRMGLWNEYDFAKAGRWPRPKSISGHTGPGRSTHRPMYALHPAPEWEPEDAGTARRPTQTESLVSQGAQQRLGGAGLCPGSGV